MRVAIYQRWLATLGGGERYTIELACALRDLGHQVTLLTHAPITADQIGQRLGLDLASITITTLADSPNLATVSAESASYDLFINTSHGDLPLARARQNVLVCFFPLPLHTYRHGGRGRRTSSLPTALEHIAGLHALEHAAPHTWAWSGSSIVAVLRRRWPAATHLALRCAPVWPQQAPAPHVHVWLDGQPLAERQGWWSDWRIPLPRPMRGSHHVRLAITPWTLRQLDLAPDDRERGIPLANITLAGPEQRWRDLPLLTADGEPSPAALTQVHSALASYQQIWAISEFSAAWVRRRWQRASAILYPAVAAPALPERAKGPLILSVGRFFAGAHNKKHLPLIQAFQQLYQQGLRGWEYHLVGGCDLDQPEQRAYLEQLQAAAQGAPIHLHVNAPLATLNDLYAQASIFWHAAGFGEDAQQQPERFEHFGIATVEAMAAGCVPVVIDHAGQREIVTHAVDGLRWSSSAELQAHTRTLIDAAAQRQQLASAASARAHAFRPAAFRQRLAQLLAALR